MSASTRTRAAALPTGAAPPRSRDLARKAAALALLQTALFAVPLVVLGRAISWPASLRLPAAEALPLIAAQADAVLLGYGAYLAVSLALIPLAFVCGTGWPPAAWPAGGLTPSPSSGPPPGCSRRSASCAGSR